MLTPIDRLIHLPPPLNPIHPTLAHRANPSLHSLFHLYRHLIRRYLAVGCRVLEVATVMAFRSVVSVSKRDTQGFGLQENWRCVNRGRSIGIHGVPSRTPPPQTKLIQILPFW